MAYRPSAPFTVPIKLLVPTTTKEYGVVKKGFTDPSDIPDSEVIFCSFRSFGGTENVRDDLYTIINTAVIDTWYRPDIKADCQIYLCETGETYDIIQQPEDIDMRHQYMRFKVQKTGGKT